MLCLTENCHYLFK